MNTTELSTDVLNERFKELKSPLSKREATTEATRCLYCFDAPCIAACPTSIDIPTFIRKISTDNPLGSAKTILESNLLGATCSRVCPVEELCEGACVLGSDHKPIQIGQLQRYAMDYLYKNDLQPLTLAPKTDKKVAIVGAGPAGLSCAGELAQLGYETTVFEKRALPGGLSTYGIVVMREPIRVSLEEVAFIEKLGVKVKTNTEIGKDISPETLLADFDAVFIGAGMGQVPSLGIAGEDLEGVTEALSFIAASKLAEKEGLERLKSLAIGKHVAVIGAGNTAIDAATIAKRLGAERVTIVYRRTAEEMPAYDFEYEFIKNEGVEFRFLSQPLEIVGEGGKVSGLKCSQMQLSNPGTDGRRQVIPVPESEWILPCDQVIKAIGQEKLLGLYEAFGLETEKGYLKVNAKLQTSHPNIYAGGDCVRLVGEAMTVTAVEDGKIAAQSIHEALSQ
ncbi:MAG: NAD(P)-dependent oxidoreductase [Trueperaceae bacterium]|nr:NAD(P)-dependent oxidoreductase [Trueperaceae bacterium]